MEYQLHQGQVEPASEFATYLAHLAHVGETKLLMHVDRGAVLAFNSAYHHVSSRVPGALDQHVHEAAADPASALALAYIYRMFDCMTETFVGSPGAVAGVAGHLTIISQRHQHRIALFLAFCEPPAAAFQVNWRIVPDSRAVPHRVVVNMQDAFEVGFLGITYQHIDILLYGQGCVGAEDIDPFLPNWLIGVEQQVSRGMSANRKGQRVRHVA